MSVLAMFGPGDHLATIDCNTWRGKGVETMARLMELQERDPLQEAGWRSDQ